MFDYSFLANLSLHFFFLSMMLYKRRIINIVPIVATATLLLAAQSTNAFVSSVRQRRQLGNSLGSCRVVVDSQPSRSRRRFVDSGCNQTLEPRQHKSTATTTTCLNLWNWNGEDIEGSNRIKACVPYLLPLLDGDGFGRYIYERVPPLGFLDSLFIGPLHDGPFTQIPFLGLIVFIALTLGTRGNTEMDRNVRFSAQQAALIDVALVFPELIGSAFEGEDIPRYLTEPCMNFVWYCYMAAVIYSIVSNLRGQKPDKIPYISGYADMMVGPF